MVAIGRFGSPHGVRGEIKFRPYEGVEDFIWDEVFVNVKEGLRRLEVTGVREHTRVFLLTLKGFNEREESAPLAGREVSVPESSIPPLPEGEYYYKDLAGLVVRSDDGRDLGRVKRVFSAGSGNDVFEIWGEYGEILVPRTKDTVKEINIEEGFMVVHLLEGMLEEPE